MAQPAPAHDATAGKLLDLQRTAGNQAVNSALTSEYGTTPSSTETSADD